MTDKVLFSKNQILHMVRKMSRQMDEDYFSKGAVHVLVMMDCGVPFATELMKHINFPVYIHYIQVKRDNIGESPKIKISNWPKNGFTDQNVLVLDVAVNHGNLMREVLQKVSKKAENYNIKIATLLKRKGAKVWINYMGGSIDTSDDIYGYGIHSGEGLDSNLTEIKIKS